MTEPVEEVSREQTAGNPQALPASGRQALAEWLPPLAGASLNEASRDEAVDGAIRVMAAVHDAAHRDLRWNTVAVPFDRVVAPAVMGARGDVSTASSNATHEATVTSAKATSTTGVSDANPPAHAAAPHASASTAECAGDAARETRIRLAAAARYTGTAFVRLRETLAMQAAANVDRHEEGALPLAGMPIAHKDMFARAGELSECGSRVRAGHIAPETATVLARLDAAGAIDLGALHMAEFAMSPTGFNAQLGHGRNPWSQDHVSGGSSSGSGVAVAARLVAAALGSDTGGSVRLPAAICGVTGIKPTQHLVSVAGVMPLSPSLDCVGFLATTAHDCARLLSVTAGADENDPLCRREPAQDYAADIERPVHDLVVAVPTFGKNDPISDEVLQLLNAASETFARAGARVERVPVPDFTELGLLANVVLGAEAASLHATGLASYPEAYGAQVRRRIERGLLYPATRYLDALRLRPIMLQQFLAAYLPQADALFLPVLPYAVPTIAATTTGTELDIEQRFGGMSYWTRAINYLGLPVLALPMGFTENGLPNGFQLVGRLNGEAALFRLGHQYQHLTDWHTRTPPPLDG
ncbi:amidase [Alcaligenaceae bacterium B3P038]|nr:amidase [Alcaligenaceae bacterium B3P038]